MILCLVLFVGLPIFIIRTLCGFANGKLCVSRDNAKKTCLILFGYAFVWLLMRLFSGEWSNAHCGWLTWLSAFLFPVFLSVVLQLFFRRLLVIALFEVLGIVLVTGYLME